MWGDVAMILFSCVAANHLGLIQAIEEKLGFRIPIVNCSRCFSYWCVLVYTAIETRYLILSVAISFLCSMLAPWVELLMGITDKIFNYAYDTIYTATESDFEDGA